MPGGHFFPDTHPKETATTMRAFLMSTAEPR
jgi:surfactin synthase thioesterase subunit